MPLASARAALAVVFVALVPMFAGCRGAAPAAIPTVSDGTPLPAPTLTPALVRRLEMAEQRVVQERGLAATHQTNRQVVSRPQLRRIFEDDIKPEDLEQIAVQQELLRFLRLIGEKDDLRALLLDLQVEQVLGFYDTETDELSIVSDASKFGHLEEFTYAHEYTHALQQAHFDIHAKSDAVRDDSEASLALTALIEGDATVSASLYAQRYLDARQIQREADQLLSNSKDFPDFIQAA